MKRMSPSTLLIVLLTIFQTLGTTSLHAQSNQNQTWQANALPRLKAIYDRGEFRPAGFKGTWLPDGSGYTIQERDSTTKKAQLWKYDAATGEKTKADSAAGKQNNNRLSPDGKYLLEFKNRDLFVKEIASGQKTRLTNKPADKDISYRDLKWSPDSQRIAFIESDTTDVRRRSVLVPDDPSYPGVRKDVFARVGGKITALRVGVVDVQGEQLDWLPIEVPDEGFYLGQVDWVPNSDDLLVETISRFRDKREFLIASPDGKLNRIYSEVNDAWAVGSHEINSGAKWIRNGEAFIFISEKDGWRHAWLLSRDGKTETKLTPGEFDLINRAYVDEAGGWYYFYASPDNATQKYLYRVPLDGGGTLERITPMGQPGTHNYEISPNAKWAFHTYSTLNTPPVVELVKLPDHKVVRVLEQNAELRKRFEKLAPRPTEFVQIDIGDGVVMDASLTKPRDFDESKKYPLFVYVYGEPYLQTVVDEWGARQIDFLRVVADAGYITVSIDNRGTAAPKGAAWRRSIFGSLGPLSTEEQAAGIQKLAEMKPYVDLDRVGIWGWSGGGSNTLNAMFRKPDVYHVGIAVVPKPQPWLYNAWFQEIYMRTREVNPDGYKRSAPINFAEGLKGKLLIITGSGETNTHIQIIEGLVDRLIELGKAFDYMVYPNRDHGLREGPGSVVHVRMLILRYLVENLPPGPQ